MQETVRLRPRVPDWLRRAYSHPRVMYPLVNMSWAWSIISSEGKLKPFPTLTPHCGNLLRLVAVRLRALCAQTCLCEHACRYACLQRRHVGLTVFALVCVCAVCAVNIRCARRCAVQTCARLPLVDCSCLPTLLYWQIQPGQIDGDNLCKCDTVFSQSKAI